MGRAPDFRAMNRLTDVIASLESIYPKKKGAPGKER
jgi:hypothetical protein